MEPVKGNEVSSSEIKSSSRPKGSRNFFTMKLAPTEQKTDKTGLNRLEMKEIARGAEKIVLSKKQTVKLGGYRTKTINTDKVYYVAVSSVLTSKNKALREEKNKMDDISRGAKDISNLAVDAKEVTHEMGIYSLEVDKAKGDFESQIRNPKTTINERVGLAKNYVSGLANLHQAGYAYGDTKPENCLVFQKGTGNQKQLTLKIADFGKSQKIGEDQTTYKGNLRFAPPEGVMSQKGDVYSAGLILIRTFEEAYLKNEEKSMLLHVNQQDQKSFSPLDKRKGIERFIVENKKFPGIDEPNLAHKLFRRLPVQLSLNSRSEQQKELQAQALEEYIEKLYERMAEDPSIGEQKAKNLQGLLLLMTASDPRVRPSMDEVKKALDNTFL